MVIVGVYIYVDNVAKRLELFNDETISITSSIQDINDIGKVFTDFSQSFTVPASKQNNSIFKHWYENSIDNGFDSRIRINAYIELDTIPFKKGKIQIEKAQYKNGVIDNYQLTFIGSLVSLKDKFAGKQLKDIDFSSYNFAYNGTVVKNRVTGGVTNDVKFPLISSKNVWQYGGGGSNIQNWDISNTATPIYTSDLFPAIKIASIFNAISLNLGLTFQGDFLTDSRFTRAFLWLKNTDLFEEKFKVTKINFQTNTSTTGTQGIFNVFTDTLTYTKPISPAYLSQSNITLTFTSSGIPFTFYVYRNGVKLNEQSYVTQTSPMYLEAPLGESGAYTFHISATSPVTYTSVYYFETKIGATKVSDVTVTQSTSQTTDTVLDIASYMPEISLEDFFTGILKMFNLTCYSTEDSVFKIEQIENWYNAGEIKDITKYLITDNIDIERSKSYKRINFNYQPSESFMNKQYLGIANHEYGDLNYELENDGEDYQISLPFENLLFSKFTATDLQVGYSLQVGFDNYIPAPVILYDYGTIENTSFKINDGSSTTTATSYNVFGQDTNISGVNWTINFGAEQSSFTNFIETNSLYYNYYAEYINNIFNIKARITKVRAIMPIPFLSMLKLNDRVIIRDKRYTINSYTTDLKTGEVNLELLNDFRTI
ncbi:hypothetical protein UFOVP324_13 [uncultured Caudovirales phage]|uniref:Uncharacterized protein n=1 Tax=uncultured Caudovirales phage TaxID=2100421 RepID=A0A6J5LVP7_9CAUD|nr:hypothetical protein UFOVP324_13 [uncultured Caudovirales phage]